VRWRQHRGVNPRYLAALNEGSAGGGCAGQQGGLDRGHVAGNHNEELARTDAAGRAEAGRRGFEHDVLDGEAGGDAGEFDESDGIDLSSHDRSFRERLGISYGRESVSCAVFTLPDCCLTSSYAC